MRHIFASVLLLLSHCLVAQNIPEPSIETIYRTTMDSAIVVNTRGTSSIFAIQIGFQSNGNSCSLDLVKFDNLGKKWSVNMATSGRSSDGTDGCNAIRKNLFASQNDGVLLHLKTDVSRLWYFDTNGNVQWRKTLSAELKAANVTQNNGYYLATADGKIEKLRSDGSSEWTIDVPNYNVVALKTTADDGFVITDNATSTRKYSPTGVLQWTVNPAGSNIVMADNGNMYVWGERLLAVVKLNWQTGQQLWYFEKRGIKAVRNTKDKGILVLTNNELYKLNTNGQQEWVNTDPVAQGQELVTNTDGNYVLLSRASNIGTTIKKISSSNQIIWQKNLTGIAGYLLPTTDNGVFFTSYVNNYAYKITDPKPVVPAPVASAEPPVEFMYSRRANNGVSYMNVRGSNSLFSLATSTGGISCGSDFAKYDNKGIKWTASMTFGYTSFCQSTQKGLYPSQDDGVLAFSQNYGEFTGGQPSNNMIKSFDANGKIKWDKGLSAPLVTASATMVNGFYLLTNANNINKIERLRGDGISDWTLEIPTFDIKALKTTPDDGFVITGDVGGTRKYSADGQLKWSITLGGNRIIVADNTSMYLWGTQGVVKLNTQTGQRLWAVNNQGIVDVQLTNDKGIVLLTENALHKIGADGYTQWTNNDLGGQELAVTPDGNYSVLRYYGDSHKSIITRVNVNNQVVWQKELKSIAYGMVPATDNGLFVSVAYFPSAFLLKIAPSPNTCIYPAVIKSVDQTCNQATFKAHLGDADLSDAFSNVLTPKNISIQWQKDGVDIPNATEYTYKATGAGAYSLKMKQGSCAIVSNITLTDCNSTTIDVPIYPNPIGDELTLEMPAGAVFQYAAVYSFDGKIMLASNTLTARNTLLTKDIPKGTHVLVIQTSKGTVSKKIVKE